MKKINILHLVPGLDAGGISMLLLNYYKKMDRSKINFDFAIFYDYIGLTGKEFEKMGSKIYHLPKKSESLKKYLKALEKILTENQYDIIHVHHNYLSFFALMIAKKCGVKVRISHCHCSSPDGNSLKQKIYYNIGKRINDLFVTNRYACGIKASEFLYGKKKTKSGEVFILNNAIDVKKYLFSRDVRRKIRTELNVNNNYVIGTVGRISEVKNQKYIINIIDELKDEIPNIKFLIVGNGELEEEYKTLIKEKKLEEYVILLGKKDNVNEILQAFDVFVLPSISEGLPVSGVEAISSSIPCIFSDVITKELELRENIFYVSLQDKEKWKEIIRKFINFERTENSKRIMMEKFDIDKNAKILEKNYIELRKK